MTPKSLHFPVAALATAALFFTGCSKGVKPVEQSLPVSPSAFPAGGGRSVAWDVTLPATATSGSMEVTEWVSNTVGEINSNITTSVDPGYVMVGGGAQVKDPGGNANNVDAILTAAYPVNDGTFSTYAGSDKDHGGITYVSDLYVYVIGVKLTSQSGSVIPTSSIIPHLVIEQATSTPPADDPFQYVDAPLGGWQVVSGGAMDNYGTGYGNLLTENDYVSTTAYAKGKDQKKVDLSTITAYALCYDNQLISGWGYFQLGYQSGTVNVNNDLMGLVVTILGNYAVAGVGGFSQSTGYGRLLYGVYSSASTVGDFQSKDQDVVDKTGSLSGIVTYIAPK